MFPIKMKSPLKVLIVVLACLVLCGGIFGVGYWQGQRALRQEMNAGQGSDLARFHAQQAMPPQPTIPANASPEMKEFLENQATLTEKMNQLRSQGPDGALSPQAFAQFRQQNADLIKQQSQLSQIIAQQQSKNTLSTPRPLQIPPNASPKLQAYLTALDQLMRDQIAFMNEHRTDNLATQQTAMQKWRQDNATRFQQLQQLAQALTPAQATLTK